MPEKRMLIVPAEVVRKIDENRGDMTQAELIEFLIDNHLIDTHLVESPQKGKSKEPEDKKYATKEELKMFEEDIKQMLKTFLDFFVSYGLELGKQSPHAEFAELSSKLHELEGDLVPDDKPKEAKIKWK